jgi:hypothetical protein
MSARLTAADHTLRAISEDALLTWVLDVAKMHGWRSYHARPGRTTKGWRTPVQGDGVGFLDVLLLHSQCDYGVVAEIKRETGRTTPEQDAWLAAFRRAGWVAMVVRPSDRDALYALLSRPQAHMPTDPAS